jgi:hypothetical protein
MKQFFLVLLLVLLSSGCHGDQPPSAGSESVIAAAKTAIKDFAGALQSELKSAMQAGGPVAAIGVCNSQALPISEKVANEHGMALSRVSLKNRNPANAPNAWQLTVLNEFEKMKALGQDVGSLTWSSTANVDGGKEFRFMKAIPTGTVCLQCHGRDISPDVSQILAGLYPGDRATGYDEGDIRGAFVVTRRQSD